MKHFVVYIIVSITLVFGGFVLGWSLHTPTIPPIIPQIKCPTCQECIIAREMYEKYIDSLQYGPRKHRAKYEDSARKYGKILRPN